MRPIEFNGVINRTETQYNQEQRPVAEQQTLANMETKQVQVKANSVNHNENAEMDSQFDSSKEGKGSYKEQENRNKKHKEDGIVTVKKKAGFDIKI